MQCTIKDRGVMVGKNEEKNQNLEAQDLEGHDLEEQDLEESLLSEDEIKEWDWNEPNEEQEETISDDIQGISEDEQLKFEEETEVFSRKKPFPMIFKAYRKMSN